MVFTVLDSEVDLSPLSTSERASSLLDAAVDAYNVSLLGNDSALLHLASRYASHTVAVPSNRLFRVNVLGVSTTAGCGAAESWLEVIPPVPSSNSKSCVPSRSWARHMYEELGRETAPGASSGLGGHSLAVDVFPFNAVAASAHGDCASSRVKRDTSLILLEVATNLFNTDVRELILRVHAAAPAAAIIFVAWPSQAWLKQMALREAAWPCCDFKRILDACHGSPRASVIDVAAVLHATRLPLSTWYAKGGKDAVHPNPFGHALLGHVVARFVAARLSTTARTDRTQDRTGERQPPPPSWRQPSPPPSAAVEQQHAAKLEAAGAAVQEVCYSSGELPLANASLRASIGWALVDDGRRKGVPKLGLASERVGDTLSIGPLPRFGARPCGVTMVKLGYLLSHSNVGGYYGAIELACRGGCHCAKVSSPFQARISPFPIVQTDAASHYDPLVRNSSPSVTLTTSFWAAWSAERPCMLHANHRQVNYPQGGSPRVRERPSRVRIDSLALRPATLAEMTHLMGHPRDPQHVNLSLAAAKCAPEAWERECEYPLAALKDYKERPHSQLGLERQLCCLTKGQPLTC